MEYIKQWQKDLFNNDNNNNYFLLTVYNRTENVQGTLLKWPPVLTITVSIFSWKVIQVLAREGAMIQTQICPALGPELFSHPFQSEAWNTDRTVNPCPHCQHRRVHTESHTHNACGWFNPHTVNEVRGNQISQMCLSTVSSFSNQVIKRMSRCPWSPKMEPNLASLQPFDRIQCNILSHFTPHFLTTNHNLAYKLNNI